MKLGLAYRKNWAGRGVLEGRTDGFDVVVSRQTNPDDNRGQWATKHRVALRGQLPRFTVVRTSSFMNPHDGRLRTGDPRFDRELVVIRSVRSQSGGYFNEERRNLILDLYQAYKDVNLNSGALEVAVNELSVTAEELIERTRSLVRIARALSVERSPRPIESPRDR